MTNRARHLLGTAGIDQSRTVVSPRLWGIASWPTRARRALRTRGNHRDDISRRAPHATDSNRPPATRTCSPFAVSPRARSPRARARSARASRVRQPVPARSVQAVSQEPPPAGSCGRSPRVFRRLHGPRDEPHVQALLQGACASTERAVGRSAPRAPAPARARAVGKYPVSVPFDSAPISEKPRISRRRRKRRARRSRTAREANTAWRDVRDARFTAVPRARAPTAGRARATRARVPPVSPR